MSKEEKVNFMVRGANTMPRSNSPQILQSEPLWKRAPTRDPDGKPYNDFMMVIPGLKSFEPSRLHSIINKVEAVLKYYEKDIVLADLNLKINVLWVTLQPRMGLVTEIAALIHHAVPEAKLVSEQS
jgi:hypothetical protein